MAIISISGRIGSGKDTVGKIIQILCSEEYWFTKNPVKALLDWGGNFNNLSSWQNNKWADALKEMLCIMTGTKREQWEDADFKNTELGEEWWYYNYGESLYNYSTEKTFLIRVMNSEFLEPCTEEDLENCLIKLTPRLLLQLLGTECGRDIIHPNIWVNALMSKYQSKFKGEYFHAQGVGRDTQKHEYPNWIITDTRFPNELKAVKDKGGISIRVNREIKHQIESLGGSTDIPEGYQPTIQHESETALDNATFDYEINNDSSIEDLIHTVKLILIREKVLCQ